MEYFVKFLEPVEDHVHDIFIGEGAELTLNLASRPMIHALRKQYTRNPKSMLITQLGVQFLFSYEGFTARDESFYRP